MGLILQERVFRHAHMACGIGAGAKGFNLANPRVGNMVGRFECAGGIDVDPGAIANFEKLTGAKGTVLDLFSREQFAAFHGKEPPRDWREATPADVFAAFGPAIDVAFASMPCKGFSGLLSARQSETDKYQALNGLTLRGMWLLLEAYKDDPIPIILFENVPRIQNRGRWLLDQIIALYRSYGYVASEDVHDCGVIGGLGQSRKRLLVIFRHATKVPPFVYRPPEQRLKGVGEIIGKLPLPGDPAAGAMHRVPALQWQTWVRLAFVEAGRDWRSLNDLRVENGFLTDFGIVPEVPLRDNALGVCRWDDTGPCVTTARAPGQGRFAVADPRTPVRQDDHLGVHRWDDASGVIGGRGGPTNGAYSVADPRPTYGPETHRHVLGVKGWNETAGVVTGTPKPSSGAHAVADPRIDGHPRSVQLGVRPWKQTAPCVKGDMSVGTGPYAVADPRLAGRPRFNNTFRIVRLEDASPAVAGPGGPAGGLAVADPRPPAREDYKQNKYRVTRMEESTGAVIAASTTGNGAFAVADPRCTWGANSHRNKLRVTPDDRPAGAIIGADRVGSGAPSVADSRREHYQTGGHFGVVPWVAPAGTVSASACHDNGFNSVADPRPADLDVEPIVLPRAKEQLVCRIVSLDGTWHRPFTTLELASLQSLFDPEEAFELSDVGQWRPRAGFELLATSDATRREWIGNAVPSQAAKAMAETIGETLLLAGMGETFTLSTREIWVKPLALALSVDSNQVAFEMERGRA